MLTAYYGYPYSTKVGGWYCLHRDDLARIAPQWLDLTKQVVVDVV